MLILVSTSVVVPSPSIPIPIVVPEKVILSKSSDQTSAPVGLKSYEPEKQEDLEYMFGIDSDDLEEVGISKVSEELLRVFDGKLFE